MRKIILFLFCLSLLVGCKKAEPPAPCDILVSIPPYLYFVDALTDGELKAASLVPSGANPHLYEPSPRQVNEAGRAKVWIRLSEHFETKIAASLQQQNKSLLILNLAEELPSSSLQIQTTACSCCHHHKESLDLHFWLSLRLAKIQAESIARALIMAFPERTSQIKKNLALLQEKLTETDEYLTKELAPFAKEGILVSHPAFGYFCHDYDLEQVSIEYEGKDPLPQQISAILEFAKSIKIRTTFIQTQYNNKGAELITEMLQLKAHLVDPYSPNYLENILYMAQLIRSP